MNNLFLKKIIKFVFIAKTIGLISALQYFLYGKNICNSGECWIKPKGVIHPLCLRLNSSDGDVFRQIFVEHEYKALNNLLDVQLIIDCGANIGLSSVYFLNKFKNSKVVAVEPDPNNYSHLKKNLRMYSDRTVLINKGIWSHPVQLIKSNEKFRDCRDWSVQVREFNSNFDSRENIIKGIDIGTILKLSGYNRISILKIDIEGAESILFSKNYKNWLGQVDSIAIELHDDSMFGNANEIFDLAICDEKFKVEKDGELTFCFR